MEQDNTSLESQVSGLGMFVGNFVHSLDPKSRITIPAVWRAQVGKPESVYVLPDFHHKCLNVYPAGEMIRKLESLRRYKMADEKARRFSRVLGGNSELLAWDTQGRIRIKDELLTFAGLTDRIVLVGALDRFELWNPENSVQGAELGLQNLREVGPDVEF
ncbi:MAG: cell division/cell wall cluster transcriptional repressor MraZ [Lentisphaerae bacterium]|nr:cell division/cell wall cluster transcriptional repressor MraZ [Lentisphaerota bacterium]